MNNLFTNNSLHTIIKSAIKSILIIVLFSGFATIVQAQAPTITSFAPTSGPVGTPVTITGTNLSDLTAFQIGGVDVVEVSNDGSTVVGLVMPGTVSGIITMSTALGSANSAQSFTVKTFVPIRSTAIGLPVEGVAGADYFGYSTCISADGRVIAAGAFGNDDATGGSGHVRVYENIAGTWTQIGSAITGEATNDGSGRSLALSADGQFLADRKSVV